LRVRFLMFAGYMGEDQLKIEKMKVRFNRWYNAVLTALLSILGFGCSSEEPMDMYGPPVEYGTPQADFILKGTVTDEIGTPVQGLKTSLKEVYGHKTGYCVDSIQTNESGNYQLKLGKESNFFKENVKLIVEDIDGEANGGEFLSDTLDIDYSKAVKVGEGDQRWYEGTFEVVTDIKLKKK